MQRALRGETGAVDVLEGGERDSFSAALTIC